MTAPGRGAIVAAALAAGVLLAGAPVGVQAAEPAMEDPISGPPPPEPADYKMDDYRSATPETLKGAKAVDTQEAERVWRDRAAVFLDTMPRDRHPPNLPPGTVWRDRPRDHIPGSAWLVNVGYGALSAEAESYFREGLKALSGGDTGKPLLFYCRAACWMSWNAAKRALEWGYSNVIWYSAGTDGWAERGLPLERAAPYAVPGAATP